MANFDHGFGFLCSTRYSEIGRSISLWRSRLSIRPSNRVGHSLGFLSHCNELDDFVTGSIVAFGRVVPDCPTLSPQWDLVRGSGHWDVLELAQDAGAPPERLTSMSAMPSSHTSEVRTSRRIQFEPEKEKVRLT